MTEQIKQFNLSTGSLPTTNASVRLFIFPMLCIDGIIRVWVFPYGINDDSINRKNKTKGISDPSGLNSLRFRDFKSKAMSDCNSPAIPSANQRRHWDLWTQSDNSRRVRDAQTHDGYLRTKAIKTSKTDNTALLNHQYAYDAYDNLTLQNILAGSRMGPSNYEYDKEDRLTHYTIPNATDIALSYDGVGNRLTDSPNTWEYDNRDRLKKRGKLNYAYDDNGSLISITHTDNGLQKSFIYNLDNRLTEVKDGSGNTIACYQYDPFGRRVSKTISGTTTYFFYAQEGLVAEMDSAGSIQTQYGYRPHGTWGTNPLFIKQAGYVGYYQNDQLGTPQQIVTASGQVIWDAHYSAFGKATVTSSVITNNLRLAGQYFDAETGLHYNYFRYYDAEIGRYVTSDPTDLIGGINVYGYVKGNPFYWIDPFGLRAMSAGVDVTVTAIVGKIGGELGVNSQIFTDREQSYIVKGRPKRNGFNVGIDGTANVAFFNGKGNGREEWTGDFDSYDFNAFTFSISFFKGGGWYGFSLGRGVSFISAGASNTIDTFTPSPYTWGCK